MSGTREDMVKWLMWGVSHAPSIHYSQSRPMPLACPPRLPLSTDCSGSITMLYHCAGVPDPNGLNYNGQGFTGTMLKHLKHIPRSQARAGDLGVYGSYPGEHVVALLESGAVANPWVYSHGSEIGPLKLLLSNESSVHRGQSLTWCQMPIAKEEPDVAEGLTESQMEAIQEGGLKRFNGEPRPDKKKHPYWWLGWVLTNQAAAVAHKEDKNP